MADGAVQEQNYFSLILLSHSMYMYILQNQTNHGEWDCIQPVNSGKMENLAGVIFNFKEN